MHRFGFDAYKEAMPPGTYHTINVGEQTLHLPWKSVATGGSDRLLASPKTDSTLTFAYQGGMPLTGTPTQDGHHVWTLNPPGGEDNLLALCQADSSGNASVAGGVRVKTYDLKRHRVAVVPVGTSQPAFTKQELQTALNAIYAQAVTEWEVTIEQPLDATGLNTTPEVNTTDYSEDMRAFWRAYVMQRNRVPGTTYLFAIPGFKDNPSMAGYMPLKSGYGFLTPQATTRDAAHELGHGVFNLRHTFSTNNVVNLPEGDTQNLMDYSSGTELFKYQWDLIHDPKGGLYLFQEEGEGASTWNPVDKLHALLFNHVYDNNHIGSMHYLKAIEDAIAKGNDDTLSLAYTENESKRWTKEQKQWIDQWKIRSMNSDDVFNDIIKAIKETEKNEKISKIVLRPKHIYIGKYTYDGVGYPVAIYGNGDKMVMTSAFTKIQVKDAKELADNNNVNHIYCDETYIKYLIIGFYEDGKEDPSMIMQVEKFDISQRQNTKEKWLEYLGILGEPVKYEITQSQLAEMFPNTDTTRLKEVMKAINNNSADFSINTAQRMSHFLGQIGAETGGMKDLNENECYSATSIKNVFGKVIRNGNRKYCDLFVGYSGTSLSTCPNNTLCECNPVLPDSISLDSLTVKDKYICKSALFDYTYACRMGNGAPTTKDGSTFKGKGFIQLTGKSKYKQISDEWNKMYPNDPKEFHGKDIDLLTTDIEIAMKASMVCWKIQGLNSYSDIGMTDAAIDQVGSIVNGSGTARPNGADHRIKYTNKAYEVLTKTE